MRIAHVLSVPAGLFLAVAAAAAEPPVDLGGVTEKHEMAPVRDGKRLSTYLYFPAGNGPWPVLYEQRYADLRAPATRQAHARLAAAGYVVAAQNFRGTHLSEGTWVGYRALGWGEKQDGFDSVEWLAAQPWSTGKVGTFGALVQLLLLTAQRKDKVVNMRRADISDGVWTIATAKREKGNAGKLKLPQMALDIIAAQPVIDSNPFVLPGGRYRDSIPTFNSFSWRKRELDKQLPKKTPHWTLHDLRRTARSLMSRAGVSRDHSERVLGHAILGVEGVYDRYD